MLDIAPGFINGVLENHSSILSIKVPASSANIGPGFDSIAVALNKYLLVKSVEQQNWEVKPLSEHLHVFPKDEQHFVCQIAIKTASTFGRTMPPLKIWIQSEIPLARGMGSSAAAIVSGIEMADWYCKLGLSKKDKLKLAARMEGHPDNVGAALYGGFVVGNQMGDGDVALTVLNGVDFDPVMVVPNVELKTADSREVLPKWFSFQQAVTASAISNQMLAAMISKKWKLAGEMLKADLFHHPYRKSLVPSLEKLEDKAVQYGAFGVAISGAGPSVLCLAEPGKGGNLAKSLAPDFPNAIIYNLSIEREGCMITYG